MLHCMYILHFVYHSFIAGTRFNLQVSLIQRSEDNCCSLCTYLSDWVLVPHPTQDFFLWFIYIFFSFIFISWRLITLQYCSGFAIH